MNKFLIVGVDPGNTTGVAILDLDKNLIAVWRKKKYSENDLIFSLQKFGVPVLFAFDRSKISSYVKKISSKYKAHVFLPENDLKVSEKRRIIKKNFPDLKMPNEHERDALASALFAYKKYKKTFEKVERKCKSNKLLIKKQILLGEIQNLKQRIKKSLPTPLETPLGAMPSAGGKAEKEKLGVRKRRQKKEKIKEVVIKEIFSPEIENKINEIEKEIVKLKFDVFKERKIRELKNDVIELRKLNSELRKKIKELEYKLRQYEKKRDKKDKIRELISNYKKIRKKA